MEYVLDCGHSKATPGKRSPDGAFREYKYNRLIGERVNRILTAIGIKCHLTYPLDVEEDLGLSKRADVANKLAKKIGAGNVLLISIHSNAAGCGGWNNAKGWSIYTTKGQTNSDKYANLFIEEAEKQCKKYRRKVRKDMRDGDGDFEENYTIIYKTICPSVLIEEFYYDCKEEMEWLMSEEGIQCCTDIIVNTILRIEGIK